MENRGKTRRKNCERKREEGVAQEKESGEIGVLRAAFTVVGAVTGAGFLSGREILVFYGGFRLLPVVCFCIFFFFGVAAFFRLGGKYGGFDGAMRALFGEKGAKAAKCASAFCSFVVGAAMLSSLNDAYFRLKPWLSVALSVLAFFLSEKGAGRLASCNAFFTAVLLALTAYFTVSAGKFAPLEPITTASAVNACSAVVYASMNVFCTAPVACELGEKTFRPRKGKRAEEVEKEEKRFEKTAWAVAAIASASVGAISMTIASAMAYDKSCYSAPMPLNAILKNSAAYSVLSAIGTATAFCCAFFSVSSAVEGKEKTRGIFLAFAFVACSALPFSAAVKILYPLAGVAGGAVIAYAVFLGAKKRKCKA